MPPIIRVKNLSKDFLVPKENKGIIGTILKKNVPFRALDNVSFTINRGEIVGYIGPNGSGKSTTIKIMSGVLIPTEGSVTNIGYTPWIDREKYTMHIGLVMGQKSLLWWDIPPINCFRLYKEIYEMDEATYQTRLTYLMDLLEVHEFVNTPTRKLSLGQRMRCELIAALIHEPEILFLDEPTIGLDVVAKRKVREAIMTINREKKTTVILTTHDMLDIENLAERVIILNKGKIMYDGNTERLRETILHEKVLDIESNHVTNEKKLELLIKKYSVTTSQNGYHIIFDSKKNKAKEILNEFSTCIQFETFELKQPSLENIIHDLYARHREKH